MSKVPAKTAEKPILAVEITSVRRDWLSDEFIGEVALPQDPVLRDIGYDLAQYRALMGDERVFAAFEQRVNAVTSKEWVVEPGGPRRADRKAADFVRELLARLPWDNITQKMLHARFYGWAVAEVVWAADGPLFTVDRILVRKRERFRFDRDRRLRLITAAALDGEVLPPPNFWVVSCGGDTDDDPYGLGLAHHIYWLVWFKRHFFKFWAVFLEKYATPTVKGILPRGAGEDERAALERAINSLAQEAGVIIPEGVIIELVEIARSAAGDYKAACSYCDTGIAIAILGQNMTTEDGSSLSQAEVHERVRGDLVKSDADLICASASQTWIATLCRLNWPDAAPPAVWRRCEPPADMDAVATRDGKILALGYEPTPEYIQATYGAGWVKRQPTAATPAPTTAEDTGEEAPPPAFAEPPPAPGADQAELMAAQLEQEAGAAWDAIIDELRDLLASSDSLDEVSARLLTLGLPVDAYADRIAQGLMAAHLCGRVQVLEETADGG